ncbi:DEAD/DEAH box helicase family protein [Halocatena salina]|uniref:DEAD/DEAH box helicase family protein n=1 Tax=Halocatena salina TaxID=2934340 RepID=A0A8U0A295_9EURY|nr:DEAD/DEAH box helicase family protein [Halocatena salina]UPM43184.1 DEAD/DEAH box helicase family protein [Halocatena salina]
MGIRDRSWKGYYPGHHDHLRDVFIPALENSIQYDRITGDFSSAVLSIFAEGLETFVKNDGVMRIITGVELFEEDTDAIERGQADDVLIDIINWDAIRDGYSEAVSEALAWLVAEGHLDFKLGAVRDEEGNVRGNEYGAWHQKLAIFTDTQGDSISIVGSPNESFKALRRNRESISVNRSWVSNTEEKWDEQRRVSSHREEFEQLWFDDALDSIVMKLPEAIERDLLQFKPDTEPDWEVVVAQINEELQEDDDGGAELPNPYPYQQRAIERFKENRNRILLEHATGAGKTWTSLFAARDIAAPDSVVIVLAPTTDLVEQWDNQDNIGQFFPMSRVIRCVGENPSWRKILYQALVSDQSTPLIAVSTMHPTTMGDLFDIVSDHTHPEQRVLIADEVHNVGAEQRRGILRQFDAAGGRLGLSATPERDDEGDQFIESYFGSMRDVILLEEAIHDYEVLSEYRYYVHIVSLTRYERDEYLKLSKQIMDMYQKHQEYDDQPLLETADQHQPLRGKIMKRANIAKEATAKDSVVTDIISDAGKKTMIFCNTRAHARRVKRAIDENSTRRVGLFFGSLSPEDRDNFREDFENGTIDTLTSIDVLTEGVDIPQCDSAILISNSLSYREAVQRRGRVLRKSEEDRKAVIHDFITLPVSQELLENGDTDLSGYEISLIEKEINRVRRMNKEAYNWERNDLILIRLQNALAMYQ